MQSWEKIGVFLAGIFLVSVFLWRGHPKPIKSIDEDELAETVLGDSAPNSSRPGPAYMSANWAPPMPLALFNPITSTYKT